MARERRTVTMPNPPREREKSERQMAMVLMNLESGLARLKRVCRWR